MSVTHASVGRRPPSPGGERLLVLLQQTQSNNISAGYQGTACHRQQGKRHRETACVCSTTVSKRRDTWYTCRQVTETQNPRLLACLKERDSCSIPSMQAARTDAQTHTV